jgi:hypothetical protein
MRNVKTKYNTAKLMPALQPGLAWDCQIYQNDMKRKTRETRLLRQVGFKNEVVYEYGS